MKTVNLVSPTGVRLRVSEDRVPGLIGYNKHVEPEPTPPVDLTPKIRRKKADPEES